MSEQSQPTPGALRAAHTIQALACVPVDVEALAALVDRETGTPQFTDQQLQDWRAYERVRKIWKYNMFDPRARQATKLGPERYSFVLANYTALRAAIAAADGSGAGPS